MPKPDDELARWTRAVLDRHNVRSSRQAEVRTGVSYATVQSMLIGRRPTAETIIRFASAYGEDVVAALRLAGYADIAEVWETGAAPTPAHEVPQETREPFYDDLPDDERAIQGMNGRVRENLRKLAPGPERDSYLALLRAHREAELALIEERLKREE